MNYVKNLGSVQISILFLILANIIWGASFPIYKWALEELPPFIFVFLRFFIGALILLPFVYKKLKIPRKDYKNLIFISIISVSIQIPLMMFGLKLAPSINAPIIIASGPIILMIASFIFLKEKLKLKTVSGTLISLLGVMAIIIEPLLVGGLTGGIMGNFLIFLATVCGVIQVLILKKLTDRIEPIALIFWMFLIGSIPLLPFALWETQSFNIITDITMKGIIGLFYGIIFAGILAHYLYIFGLKFIKASEVGIFSYVDPFAAIIVAVPLLGEEITPPYLIGALLVFFGIFIAEGRIHYHPFNRLFTKDSEIN